MRAPVWLYRARLGAVFGYRLLMLEHVGRKTGARRYAVLEVVDHRPGTYVVVSGLGARARWLHNVQANPKVRVHLGSRPPVPARARLLTPDEASSALTAYAAAHPRAWAVLRPVFASTLGARIGDRDIELPLVALDLTTTAG